MSSVAAYLMYDVSLIIMCLWCYETNGDCVSHGVMMSRR